jgi:hypothetical protein
MTTIRLLTLSLAALIFAACTHTDPEDPDAPRISLINPEGSGKADARRDLKAGKLQLIEVPTIGLAPPDAASNDPRFSNITKRHLGVDGNDRHAAAWVRYAKAYNAVVIKDFEKEVTR